jgi:hypothetical protein
VRLAFLISALLLALSLVAAEKPRDWQTGKLLESGTQQTVQAWGSILNQRTALVNQRVNVIQSEDKEYLVIGYVGNVRHPVVVGEAVRFAVDGDRMFVSVDGKEYRLVIQNSRVRPIAK